ncbi:MAG: antitoxin VapB family protein [Candidatus Hydrothermarchaeota archaeon]|nr:antitoxin VapB family protein [Candidatus Hydrothermarchaeota archaeon]
MGYRTIGVSDEAYETLSRWKRNSRSFSNAILKLDAELRKKRNIMKFAGIWSAETAEKVERLIKEEREHAEAEARKRANIVR